VRISYLLTKVREWKDRLSKRSKGISPLVSHKNDVKLLQSLRGRRVPTPKQWIRFPGLLSEREKYAFGIALLVFVISIGWFGSLILSSYRTTVPAVGGRYIEAVVGTPQRVNPLFASINDIDVDIVRLVYSGLMRHDAEQRLVPDLATKFEVSEDKKTYTFALRKTALWHDGEPFTADDVVYTFEAIQDPAVGSPLLVSFQGVLVEKIDDYTVTFTLPEPFPSFLSSLTVGILPEHIWLDIPTEQIRLSQKNIQPIGTGPYAFFKLVKDEKGQILQYELKRFEDWYRQTPYIETFVFAFYTSYDGPGGAIQDLREKKVNGLHFVPYDLREQVNRKHLQQYTLQLPQYTALMFNQTKEIALEEKDVRTALAYALDKERILREALENEGQIIYSPILPGFPGYNPEQEKTPYNTNLANELLDGVYDRLEADEYKKQLTDQAVVTYRAENGIGTNTSTEDGTEEVESSGENTTEVVPTEIPEDVLDRINSSVDSLIDPAQPFFRTDEDGNILSLTIVTSDTAEYNHAAKLIAGMWQEIGIYTEIILVPAKDISREVLKNRNYDVLLYGMIVGNDPDQYPFWHSSQVAFPGLNLSQYVNRSIDTILEEAREGTDSAEQAELYGKFQDQLLADVPAVFLYMPTYTYVIGDMVTGFEVVRISHPADRFNSIESWYTKTKRVWNFSQTP
jgi:ABC-type transport system substrate-binding protein